MKRRPRDCLTGKSLNPVQPPLQKNFASPLTQISNISLTVPSHRGALAIVTNAGRDAVDAAASGACGIAGQALMGL
jgi:hypothetical protein